MRNVQPSSPSASAFALLSRLSSNRRSVCVSLAAMSVPATVRDAFGRWEVSARRRVFAVRDENENENESESKKNASGEVFLAAVGVVLR